MSLVGLLYKRYRQTPNEVVLSQLLPAVAGEVRQSKTWTAESFLKEVASVAKYLEQFELRDRPDGQVKIAIISNTRPEWLLADFAVMFNDGVSVSVYQTLTANEIAYILYDSGAEIVFAENQEQVDKLLSLMSEEIDIPAVEDRPASKFKLNLKKIIAFDSVTKHPDVIELAEILSQHEITDLPECPVIPEDRLASLVYTSGTTGMPKGVIQTHANHLANIRQAETTDIVANNPKFFLFLPLAHSFAKLMAYLGVLSQCQLGLPAIYEGQGSKFIPEKLNLDISGSNAHIIPLVPRVLEKVQAALQQKSTGSSLQAKLLGSTLRAAKNRECCVFSKIGFALLSPIRGKIKKQIFGDNFRFVVSGGAKLNSDVNLFFEQLGLCVLQGYGLTETCVATNINPVRKNKIGTVGPTLDKTIEMQIADDGEIIFRGPNVSQGYWQRPEATAKSWDSDGWFKTGDLGSIDNDGYLSITGRKKEIIVTSYGKKIAPLDIEAQLNKSPYVESVLIHGSGRKFCVALFVLNEVSVASYLKDKNIQFNKLTESEAVYQLIDGLVAKVNEDLADYEKIKKFTFASEPFTIENGLLTPTMKIKRNKVFEQYAAKLDSLY